MRRATLRNYLGPALIAAVLSVIIALTLRYLLNIAMPAELFADQATLRMPPALFDTMLTLLDGSAKHFYLIGALVVEALLVWGAGLAYVALRQWLLPRLFRRPLSGALTWWDAPGLAVWLYLLSALILAPVLGGGLFGAAMNGSVSAVLISQVAPDVIFAVALVWQIHTLVGEQEEREEVEGGEGVTESALLLPFSRRAFFQQAATATGLLVVGIGLWEGLTSGLGALLGIAPPSGSSPALDLRSVPTQISPPPTPNYGPWIDVAGQSPELTSAANFYYVSKNLASDPAITLDSWSLSIGGMVNKPYRLTYDQLRALPHVEQYHTLECISNDVGGPYISNGLFVGVKLADVLNAAGIQQGANQMTFYAADGYSDSLHLAQALDERSLVVYLLDGAPLPQSHGYPARLLIPGLYGMKNGKWLTSFTLGNTDYNGYWEQRGWTPIAKVKLMSRIDTPHDSDLLAEQPTSIAGIAYSGADGIAAVEVSVDAGRTWNRANLRKPLGALSWTLWEYPWLPGAGQHVIAVRAIDLVGRVQQPNVAPPLPDGSSGYHAISVTVR